MKIPIPRWLKNTIIPDKVKAELFPFQESDFVIENGLIRAVYNVLIDIYLTTFNIANKLLKLNSNGLIDNTLLKNQYIYLDTEVVVPNPFNSNQLDGQLGYKIYKKADGTIERMEQWGLSQAYNSSTTTYSFHTPFNSKPAAFGGGISAGPGSMDSNATGMYPISATQFRVFSDENLNVISWRAWGK